MNAEQIKDKYGLSPTELKAFLGNCPEGATHFYHGTDDVAGRLASNFKAKKNSDYERWDDNLCYEYTFNGEYTLNDNVDFNRRSRITLIEVKDDLDAFNNSWERNGPCTLSEAIALVVDAGYIISRNEG